MALATALERLTSPWDHLAQENPFVGFLDTLLRGTGQVMFQNNPLTGLLFLIGIFVNSALLGLAALIGLIVSTLTAIILGADRTATRAGLFGYNGILAGIGLAFFVQWNGTLVVYIVLVAILTTIVMMALINFMGERDMPALTAPFVISTWLFLFAIFQFAHLRPTAAILPTPLDPHAFVQTELRPLPGTMAGAGVTALNLVTAFFRGIGEVFFQDNLITGIIFLIAILINSRIAALFAALGSLIGMLSALFLFGGNGYWVYHGLYGFNGVLTGIVLGGLFFVLTWESTIYALIGILISTVLMAAISVALSPIGMPALTAPFVLTGWLFVGVKAGFRALRAVPLAALTTPEQIRQNFLEEQRVATGPRHAPEPTL
ncbi:MAG TPA: urea transporter [Ktedonobacteraceae bacterium]|nr:urea transporter [Ktedonobacteraceae bacterium]